MQLRNVPSWQISERLDQGLAFALFVRDRVGLGPYVVTTPDVGELEPVVARPSVGRSDDDVDLAAAVREWPQWWARALRASEEELVWPGRPAWGDLADLTTVTALVDRHLDEFHAWLRPVRSRERDLERRHDPLHLTTYVNAFERRLGRTVRPFRLRLRAVPVAGAAGWVVDENQVVLSLRLLGDARALETFLEPVVMNLA